jgi:hypothetical protein
MPVFIPALPLPAGGFGATQGPYTPMASSNFPFGVGMYPYNIG